MNTENTTLALASVTDEGLFERLAMAILREANPIYRSLAHTGVNIAGKTVKAPLDGICFVQGSSPPHMIAVHHTITARADLEKKWLHDPSEVKPRNGSKPTAPAGDLIKTADLAAAERKNTPNLRVTLVLTTNQEPSEVLVRAVEKAGRDHDLEIDLWTVSRLSHFLDNKPTGQWIRWSFLSIKQEQLSPELLYELSKKSLEIYRPPDNPSAWIPRALDAELATSVNRAVTFLVAGSGLGKSIACYRTLATHIESGGFGFILPHNVVASAMNLEQAIVMTLRQLHPSLAEVATPALSFFSPERPLILVVEDINRSGQAQFLAEKLASWHPVSSDRKTVLTNWRLICPLWPEVLTSLVEQVKKRITPLTITADGFTKDEGREAVLVRARLDSRQLSELEAEAISCALGHDPLLIALYDKNTAPELDQVISQFVEGSLSRAAAEAKDLPATDYRQALRALARGMLESRQVDLYWREVSDWAALQGEPLRLLGRLAHQGELVRFSGPSGGQRLSFRHDRVRDWILADATSDLDQQGILAQEVLAEPYFAEVMGSVLVWGQPKSDFLTRVAMANPLALFYALRLFSKASSPCREHILQAINDWLDKPTTHNDSNSHLRWEAQSILAETDSPEIPAIVRRFHEGTISGELAQLRNGDILGGISLCNHIEPGVTAPWRDLQVEHAKLWHGRDLTKDLDIFLRQPDLEADIRIGALRLAGHLADPGLALAIEACWASDVLRRDHLAEYLWAFGECCVNDLARFLGPVCDEWAALPDVSDIKGMLSPRSEVSDDHLRWAFRRWPPVAALDYFIQRGSKDELRSEITYMLHGMDHPKAVFFVVQELARIQQRLEGKDSFSPFVLSAKDDWRRAQEDGHPMSQASRELLLELWREDTNDMFLRSQAFSLWASTQDSCDIEILRIAKPSDDLTDKILAARLTRGDQQAIPAMIDKLDENEHGYWWQYGRYIWSPELTDALDEFLERRGAKIRPTWGETFVSDWITSEMIMRLPESDAERLLLKHWGHLRFEPHFVQAALYVSTPSLLDAAQATISECPEPATLMKYLGQHIGIHTSGRPGLTREAQVLALTPYLGLLSAFDLRQLWETCNERGWYTLRKKFLDSHLEKPYLHHRWDSDHVASELDKMVAEKHIFWIGHWIDDYLKTGVSWDDILITIAGWLDERRSLDALEIVSAAVIHRGTRKDLDVLRIHEGMPENTARQLIADAQFAVSRRSIR